MVKSLVIFYKTLVIVVIILFIGVAVSPLTESIVIKESNLPKSEDNTSHISRKREDDYAKIPELVYNSEEILLNGKIAYAYMAYSPGGKFGPCYFRLDDPGNITGGYGGPSGDFLSGGTWTTDDRWFGCEYGSGLLWEIDPESGEMKSIGGGGMGCNGLAWDPVYNRLYGTTGNLLLEYDPDTGEQNYIGNHKSSSTMIALAINLEGVCYSWDVLFSGNSTLYKIDLETGEATEVGSMGEPLLYAQDGAFDWDSGILYLAAYYSFGWLATCNLETGELTSIGKFEDGAELDALAIPYNWSHHPVADFNWKPNLPNPNETILFDASDSYDPDGYITLYEWDWNNDGVFDENHTNPTATYSWPDYGFYNITLRVKDNNSLTRTKTKTVRVGNQPPEAPTIDGPTRGKAGVELCWTFNTTDQENDSIFIYVDWGDGTFEDWFGPYLSPIKLCHTYEEKKTYTIRAKVKDIYGAESEWAEFEVTIPRNKMSFNSLHLKLFERFLVRFPILEGLLNFQKYLV